MRARPPQEAIPGGGGVTEGRAQAVAPLGAICTSACSPLHRPPLLLCPLLSLLSDQDAVSQAFLEGPKIEPRRMPRRGRVKNDPASEGEQEGAERQEAGGPGEE